MRFYQKRQMEMLSYTAALLKNNKEYLIKKVPVLKNIIEEFMSEYNALLQLQNRDHGLVAISTIEKHTAREALVNIIWRLSGMLKAHRFQNKNNGEDKKKTKPAQARPKFYSLTELRRATTDELCNLSEKVLNSARRFKFLEHYGINQDDIKDAEAYYKEFISVKGAPKESIKEKARHTGQFKSKLQKCIAMLEYSIDPLIIIATADNNELLGHYKASRKVLPKGQGRPSDAEAAYRRSRTKKASVQSMRKS